MRGKRRSPDPYLEGIHHEMNRVVMYIGEPRLCGDLHHPAAQCSEFRRPEDEVDWISQAQRMHA